ncbi:MAG TPA: hypothetical protein VGG63_17380 [Steroidobacteraceae bacterium]|jgi:hypothetical protein
MDVVGSLQKRWVACSSHELLSENGLLDREIGDTLRTKIEEHGLAVRSVGVKKVTEKIDTPTVFDGLKELSRVWCGSKCRVPDPASHRHPAGEPAEYFAAQAAPWQPVCPRVNAFGDTSPFRWADPLC